MTHEEKKARWSERYHKRKNTPGFKEKVKIRNTRYHEKKASESKLIFDERVKNTHMLMDSFLKDVVGYEGMYSVTKDGRVFSWLTLKFLKPRVNNGYLVCVLRKDGESRDRLVHRLVAEAYIPNPNNYPIVNHKDENPLNCKVENLEWCDKSYNMLYGEARKKQKETRVKNSLRKFGFE